MGSRYNEVQQTLDRYKEQLSEANENLSNETSAQEEWPPKVQRALAFIIAHLFDTRLSVSWMKEQCRINGHNFSSKFRHYLGKTPKQYILHHRIVVAKLLLSNNTLTSIKLSTVVYELGFSDFSTFSKCFKRETGMPPGQWRA